mmetsp:Transcript_1535/g.2468  ORF Transcript_1535/g.2468 Transcript_1535/m.2468 type:complete len:213 (-) Transcript_1535:325-963(-)
MSSWFISGSSSPSSSTSPSASSSVSEPTLTSSGGTVTGDFSVAVTSVGLLGEAVFIAVGRQRGLEYTSKPSISGSNPTNCSRAVSGPNPLIFESHSVVRSSFSCTGTHKCFILCCRPIRSKMRSKCRPSPLPCIFSSNCMSHTYTHGSPAILSMTSPWTVKRKCMKARIGPGGIPSSTLSRTIRNLAPCSVNSLILSSSSHPYPLASYTSSI